MKTYQYYSAILKTEVQVTYNKHGLIHGFQANTQIEAIASESPEYRNFFREEDFLASARHYKIKLTQVQRIVTFDMFWEAYKEKNCGRTKAEATWNKLSVADQIEAFDFIPAFNGILKMNGTAKPYATTYLNSKRWIR